MAVTNTVTGKMNYLTVGSNTYEIEDKNAAPLASPAFTGTPTAPTATAGTSTTQIATTKFVMDAMSGAGAGTVTSVGISNATNGGLSISGSPVTSSGTITVGHSNILTSAQTTQAVYPIKIDKNGHISAYGSAVTIPTKTSDLTNDSGFITSYTDEKLALAEVTSTVQYYPIVGTGTTASTRQCDTTGFIYIGTNGTTSTVGTANLTLGNATASGTVNNKRGQIYLYGTSTGRTRINTNATSGTSVVSFPDKGGTVALTDDIPTVPTITLNGSSTTSPSFYAPTSAGTDGYVLKSNGSGTPSWTSATLTDINVQTNVATSGNTYRLIGTSATSFPTTGVTYLSNTQVKIGTDTTTLYVGTVNFPGQIGLSVTSGGEGFYTIIKSAATAGTTITLPNATGTVALTSNIPTITLNDSSTTSPSFYAPTSAGTSGYYLKSTGSGAPSWASISIPSAGTSASAVGTSASGGSALTYSKSDHVHNITSSTITSALGYTPYNSTNPNGYVTTDEKLTISGATSDTLYDILLGSGTSASTRQYDGNSGLQYIGTSGAGSTMGTVKLIIGNARASSDPGDRRGFLTIYGSGTYGTTIQADPSSANNTVTLPASTGTLVLDSEALLVANKYTRSSAGNLEWTNNTEGDSKIIMKSALAFWDGAYSGSSSNLTYCKNGTILGSNVSQSTNPLKDYITLQGTTGSTWTYRKWNSGLQECWYHGSITFSTAGSAYQNWYRSTQTISLPTATGFTAFSDSATVVASGAYNGHILTSAGLVKTNGTQLEVQILGGNAIAASTAVPAWNIYICGFARS